MLESSVISPFFTFLFYDPIIWNPNKHGKLEFFILQLDKKLHRNYLTLWPNEQYPFHFLTLEEAESISIHRNSFILGAFNKENYYHGFIGAIITQNVSLSELKTILAKVGYNSFCEIIKPTDYLEQVKTPKNNIIT